MPSDVRSLKQRYLSPRGWLDGLNALLGIGNVKVVTLTAERREAERLAEAKRREWFVKPVYTVPAGFTASNFWPIVDALPGYAERFASFRQPETNDVGYQYENPYFRSPDTEVLYTIMRQRKPQRVIEIGCGHSTRVIRQATRDGDFPCHLTCIDPSPRRDVSSMADQFVNGPIEMQDAEGLAASLDANDVLFIDTSHEARVANDVAFIYCNILPRLKAGVIVHIHDVFLPWEYPETFVFDAGLAHWGEQYLVHALLAGAWDVIWPGYYLQQTRTDFTAWFPWLDGRPAQSLWIARR